MLPFSFYRRKMAKIWLLFFSTFIIATAYSQDANIFIQGNDFPDTVGQGFSRRHETLSENSRTLLNLMRQIDSMSHTAGIARHFASIYTNSMGNIKVQLAAMDSGAQAFVTKFEISFISYFLEACIEYNNGTLSPESVWYFYFSNPKAEPWQLTLIGVNAHINGDIWKGLVKNFSEKEIQYYKKNLLSFQKSIAKAFQPFFDELMEQSSYLRFIDGFTKGASRRYGEWLIYNWRLRQINLAMLYFEDKEKFEQRFEVINRKKHRIDQIIIRKRNWAVSDKKESAGITRPFLLDLALND
jgi:hypothetical protein